MVVLGFSSVSIIPLSLSFAAELTFPLQPAMVNGAIILAGQMVAVIQNLIFAFMIDVKTTDDNGLPVPED